MNKRVMTLLMVFTCTVLTAQTPQELKNLQAFTKIYGYVKYFHPADEAFQLDWDHFAIHGAKEIAACPNDEALLQKLNALFLPIAPAIKITNAQTPFDFSKIHPKHKAELQPTYWQHEGVNYGNFEFLLDPENYYQSVRVNKPSTIETSGSTAGFAFTTQIQEAWKGLPKGLPFRVIGHFHFDQGKRLRYGRAPMASFFMNVDLGLTNMPIPSDADEVVILSGTFVDYNKTLRIGVTFTAGTLTANDIRLEIKKDGKWQEAPLKLNHFESESVLKEDWFSVFGENTQFKQQAKDGKYPLTIVKGNMIGEITGEAIFAHKPEEKQLIEEEVVKGVYVQIPQVLYFDKTGTLPHGTRHQALYQTLEKVEYQDDMESRLGNFINTWNLLHHFFPYQHYLTLNWEQMLTNGIKSAYQNKPMGVILEELLFECQDAHMSIHGTGYYYPLFSWERLAEGLIVTSVAEEITELQKGDEVIAIDNQPVDAFFKQFSKTSSSFSAAARRYEQNFHSLRGAQNTAITLTLASGKTVSVPRVDSYPWEEFDFTKQYLTELSAEALYFNTGLIQSEKEYQQVLDRIPDYPYLVVDLRNDINRFVDDGQFIRFFELMCTTTESPDWMYVHQRIAPHQKEVKKKAISYEPITPKNTYKGKVIFLVDGSVTSYPETVIMLVQQSRKDIVIIGEQSAGGNGNINPFILPGGYTIYYTGMEVKNLDGSAFFGKAIQPHIPVEKTKQDIISGTDPWISTALDYVNKRVQDK